MASVCVSSPSVSGTTTHLVAEPDPTDVIGPRLYLPGATVMTRYVLTWAQLTEGDPLRCHRFAVQPVCGTGRRTGAVFQSSAGSVSGRGPGLPSWCCPRVHDANGPRSASSSTRMWGRNAASTSSTCPWPAQGAALPRPARERLGGPPPRSAPTSWRTIRGATGTDFADKGQVIGHESLDRAEVGLEALSCSRGGLGRWLFPTLVAIGSRGGIKRPLRGAAWCGARPPCGPRAGRCRSASPRPGTTAGPPGWRRRGYGRGASPR